MLTCIIPLELWVPLKTGSIFLIPAFLLIGSSDISLQISPPNQFQIYTTKAVKSEGRKNSLTVDVYQIKARLLCALCAARSLFTADAQRTPTTPDNARTPPNPSECPRLTRYSYVFELNFVL